MARQQQQMQDPHAMEESKKMDEAMPALVGPGPRQQQVTLELLFDAILDLKREVRELRQELSMVRSKAQKAQQASPEHRIQVYFRDGAESLAKEVLAKAIREYIRQDTGKGDTVVSFGGVQEGPWHALALISRDIVRPTFAKILKQQLQATNSPDIASVKPFPDTKLFAMPLQDRQEMALTLLLKLLRGRQPQEDNSSLISRCWSNEIVSS